MKVHWLATAQLLLPVQTCCCRTASPHSFQDKNCVLVTPASPHRGREKGVSLDRWIFFLTHCNSSKVLHLQYTFTIKFLSLTSRMEVSEHLMVSSSFRPQVSAPSCTYKPGATATITEAIWDREDLILSPKISRALWPSECFFIPCEVK